MFIRLERKDRNVDNYVTITQSISTVTDVHKRLRKSLYSWLFSCNVFQIWNSFWKRFLIKQGILDPIELDYFSRVLCISEYILQFRAHILVNQCEKFFSQVHLHIIYSRSFSRFKFFLALHYFRSCKFQYFMETLLLNYYALSNCSRTFLLMKNLLNRLHSIYNTLTFSFFCLFWFFILLDLLRQHVKNLWR